MTPNGLSGKILHYLHYSPSQSFKELLENLNRPSLLCPTSVTELELREDLAELSKIGMISLNSKTDWVHRRFNG